MSGGVDSSVVAALLVEQGYQVAGLMMKIPTEKDDAGVNEAFHSFDYDARRVADKLRIPFFISDFEDLFRQTVIDYFINEYKSGRTPNPCVFCNKHIKFGALLDRAKELGMDYMATGHYARVEFDESLGRFLLKRATPVEKDQSYVLYSLTQKQLSKVLFPIGNFTKEQVREKAENFQLPVANKRDSQEICFIADNNYVRFLEENDLNISKPGNFVDKNGNILGRHKGIIHYTIGQRRGLEIAFGTRMFVSGININDNTVILGPEEDLYSSELIASQVNFIPFDKLAEPLRVTAKIRYSAKDSSAIIKPTGDDKVAVVFEQAQRAITPGQAVVFYNGDIVVGGGIID